MVILLILGTLIVLCFGIHFTINRIEKRICGLCAERHEWAKRKDIKACDCYGCIYDMEG